VVLLTRGPHALYTQTYGASTSGLTLPCPTHAGLWPDTGVPYPPLGVFLHAPVAFLERAGLLSPALAHALLTWLFGVVGALATFLAARALHSWRRWLFVALFGPLLVGAGLSGFYDVTFVLAAVLAVTTRSTLAAVLAYLVHFRGIVGLTLADVRKPWAVALIALNSVVAFVASQHLGVFETNSRLHFTRTVAWWFPAVTGLAWWFTRREGLSWTLLVTAGLMFTDRQPSFWHLLVLVPLVLRALKDGTTRTAIIVVLWTCVTAQAFLDTWVPFPVVWLTMR
jgi:hypothetical protein